MVTTEDAFVKVLQNKLVSLQKLEQKCNEFYRKTTTVAVARIGEDLNRLLVHNSDDVDTAVKAMSVERYVNKRFNVLRAWRDDVGYKCRDIIILTEACTNAYRRFRSLKNKVKRQTGTTANSLMNEIKKGRDKNALAAAAESVERSRDKLETAYATLARLCSGMSNGFVISESGERFDLADVISRMEEISLDQPFQRYYRNVLKKIQNRNLLNKDETSEIDVAVSSVIEQFDLQSLINIDAAAVTNDTIASVSSRKRTLDKGSVSGPASKITAREPPTQDASTSSDLNDDDDFGNDVQMDTISGPSEQLPPPSEFVEETVIDVCGQIHYTSLEMKKVLVDAIAPFIDDSQATIEKMSVDDTQYVPPPFDKDTMTSMNSRTKFYERLIFTERFIAELAPSSAPIIEGDMERSYRIIDDIVTELNQKRREQVVRFSVDGSEWKNQVVSSLNERLITFESKLTVLKDDIKIRSASLHS